MLNGNPFGCYISSFRILWNWTLNRTTPPNLKVMLICLKFCHGSIFPYPLENLSKGFIMWTIPTNYTIFSIFSFLPRETPCLSLSSSSFSHHATFITTKGCFQLLPLLASNLSSFLVYFKLQKAQKKGTKWDENLPNLQKGLR